MKAEVIRTPKATFRVAKTPDQFPFGERGQRPISVIFDDFDDAAKVKEAKIPGVFARNLGARCSWDGAMAVARILGVSEYLLEPISRRTNGVVPTPGMARYKELGLDKVRKPYQSSGMLYLLRRAYAILGDPPRAGKCLMSIMTSVISGTSKTLIICNSLGKYVWGEEIAKWAREEAVLLFGRAGHEVRRICRPCLGAGFTYANDDKSGECVSVNCKTCKGKGELVFEVRKLQVVTEGRVVYEDTGKLKKDGTPRLQRRVARYCPLPARFVCPIHPEEVDSRPRPCSVCRAEVLSVIERAKWVIVNYDILNAQKDKTERGREYMREDLPGWGPVLGRFRFEMALADESHRIRGWQGKGPGQKEAATRRERACEVCADIPRVYAVTGTPVYGFTRDLWSQLDFITDGLWS